MPHSQAESAVERFGRGVLWQLQAGLCLSGVSRNGGRLARQLLGWIEHYNHQAPHSALGMQSPAECYAEWLVRNKTRPFQN
ncbi:MAG: transposase [Nitrospirae bacterium]|nr:MAG: transposase [Nitrospirota bacterium]